MRIFQAEKWINIFSKNLDKVTTSLSKEEDDGDNDEDNTSDAGGRSNDISMIL